MSNMKQPKTICILTGIVPRVNPWDPDTIQSGITGSEEAVIYISQQLAELGYKVIVLGDPPENSRHSRLGANPRYLNINKFQINEKIDIAIAWRHVSMGIRLKQFAKKVYLWPHDTLGQPLTNDEIDVYDDVLWLSEWQRLQWISVNPRFAKYTRIYGNGVNPDQFLPIQPRANPYSCIYGSNYARGLAVMLDIWPHIKKKEPRATLDIYYGWQTWGMLTSEMESKMRKQIAKLPDVREHGLVSHEELNHAYASSSFWTYPCIMPETFCITALRAQLSGAVPVVIQGTALPETVRHGYRCARPDDYLSTLLKAFSEAEKISLEDRNKMGDFIRKRFTWREVALRWDKVFDRQAGDCA